MRVTARDDGTARQGTQNCWHKLAGRSFVHLRGLSTSTRSPCYDHLFATNGSMHHITALPRLCRGRSRPQYAAIHPNHRVWRLHGRPWVRSSSSLAVLSLTVHSSHEQSGGLETHERHLPSRLRWCTCSIATLRDILQADGLRATQYYEHRITNGITWVETLASLLAIPVKSYGQYRLPIR